MKHSFTFIFFFIILQWVVVLGQTQDMGMRVRKAKLRKNVKAVFVDTVVTNNAKFPSKYATDEIRNITRHEIKQLNPDSLPKTTAIQNRTKDRAGKILKQKTSNLQYDSDHPEDAPWKKEQLSKDDLNNLGLPSVPTKNNPPSFEDKAAEYRDKVDELKPSAPDEGKLHGELSKTAGSNKLEKVQHNADSLSAIKNRISGADLQQELLGAKKIYSEKYIRKVYDSLGVHKADSIFQVASRLAKTETPKEELLGRINTSLKEQADKAGIGFDEKNQSLKMDDAEKLQGLPGQYGKADLTSMQLPGEVLSELAPLTGTLTDSKYMPLIDSMRQVAMKAKGYKLDEQQMTEELKRTALEKKPGFMDKSYFEGILGFVNDTTFSIVQVSPSWGYHFTDHFSVGLGPNISVQYQARKVNAVVGFRSFAKFEFLRQRAYAQLEDNVMPSQVNKDVVRRSAHSILVGGGGLLPLSKKLAINLAVFYRVNQKEVAPSGSPWVFRVGLSTVKNTGQK